MTERAPVLSVIIVTWNVRDLTLDCLTHLHRATEGMHTEVIVVDNASTDGTVDALRNTHPDIRVIANRENVGFPAANNQALAMARGKYVLFLNPDTRVGTQAVRACMDSLEKDAAIGMAGCRLDLENGAVQLECARRPYLLQHMLIETLYLHMLMPRNRIFGDHLMSWWDHRDVRDVEAICGAFMLARADVARQVRGLPEDVFMYHEDLAFCLRVRQAGWRIRYRGDVSTVHLWRGSSSKSSESLALLEGAYKIRLIRDAQGDVAAAAARALFAIRCASRLLLAAVGQLLPMRGVRQRYPRVFDVRTHGLQLMWAVAPFTVAHRVPGAARQAALT
jgi:GT2 family glycosyltransferase